MIPEEQRLIKSTTLRSDVPAKNGEKTTLKNEDSYFKSKSPSFYKTSKSIKISVRQHTQRKNKMTPE